MKLSLNSRQVGEVTVITCGGRIVAGPESASLDDHVKKLLPLTRLIILHLGEVDFVDSSGIGLLVRLLTRTRTAGRDLKLCNLNPNLVRTLKITNLSTVLETHSSETEAISAFYRRSRTQTKEDNANCSGPRATMRPGEMQGGRLCHLESVKAMPISRLLRRLGFPGGLF